MADLYSVIKKMPPGQDSTINTWSLTARAEYVLRHLWPKIEFTVSMAWINAQWDNSPRDIRQDLEALRNHILQSAGIPPDIFNPPLP